MCACKQWLICRKTNQEIGGIKLEVLFWVKPLVEFIFDFGICHLRFIYSEILKITRFNFCPRKLLVDGLYRNSIFDTPTKRILPLLLPNGTPYR